MRSWPAHVGLRLLTADLLSLSLVKTEEKKWLYNSDFVSSRVSKSPFSFLSGGISE